MRFLIKIFIMTVILWGAAGLPCAAEESAPAAIHSVAVSPGSTVVTKNATCTFTATVTGENGYSSEVVWSVSGQTSQSTFIDSKGVLNVAADEGASSLVVKAVSRQDSAYSATALATIQTATYRVNISVNDGNGGTATEGKTVNAGENMTIKATPKEGWRFVEWKENDKSISTNQEFTLENIMGERNLTAVFEKEPPKTYTVTASVSSSGGIITPTGASPVPAGSWIGYAITPDRGCRVRMVYVDGAAIGAATSYNFTDVHGDHTISAEFEPDPAQTQPNPDQTVSDDPEQKDSDKTGQTGKNDKTDTVKPKQEPAEEEEKTPDKEERDAAAQKAKQEKEEAAKAEREKMERERMEREQAEAEAERAQRVELEKEKIEREKAEAEKAAAQQKAEKQRQGWIIFGIVAAAAVCALIVLLVVKRRG